MHIAISASLHIRVIIVVWPQSMSSGCIAERWRRRKLPMIMRRAPILCPCQNCLSQPPGKIWRSHGRIILPATHFKLPLSGAGATWSSIVAGLPDLVVTQIAVSPINSLTAYVTMSGFNFGDGSGHVYQTTNGGANWTNVTGDLPDIPVNDLVIDPDIPNTLYIATDIGVFRSVDGGGSWLPLASGLPYVVVNSVKLHEPTRTLRAATYGRGVWDLWVPVGNQVPVGIVSSPSGAPFQLEDGTIYQAPVTFSWTPGAQHTVTWLNTWAGLAGAPYIFQNLAGGGGDPP